MISDAQYLAAQLFISRHHIALSINSSEEEVAQSIVLTIRELLYNVGTVFYTRTKAIYPVPFKVIFTANRIADN